MQITTAQVSVFVDGKPFKNLKPIENDSLHLFSNRILNEFWREGYLFAAQDSLVHAPDMSTLYLHRGSKVNIVVDSVMMEETQVKMSPSYNTIGSYLEHLVDAGYPFAMLSWDSLYTGKKGQVHGVLELKSGPFIENDTIHLLSSIETRKDFIQRTLDMRVGEPYSESGFQNIPRKIRRVSFLKLKSLPDIGFSGGKAKVYLDVQELPASSFEGVIGFLPNQAQGDKLQVTGYLDLQLANLFSTGRALSMKWQKFSFQSQQLDLAYHHPYLFNSKILLDFGFNLVKQDTTFINRRLEFGVGTYLWKNIIFNGNYNRFSGNLTTSNSDIIQDQGIADYKTDLYTVNLSNSIREDDFQFTNDWTFRMGFSVGKKSIERNPNVPTSFYDSIDQETTLFKFDLSSSIQRVLFGKTALFYRLTTGGIENKEILKNELYRIGGLKSLRGFNENFFYAQYFVSNRIELRQYFESRSYFMAFYDNMFYKTNSFTDIPMGLGVGFSLATSNGLFNFAYALGSSDQQAFSFTESKIHFGYISRF